MCLDDMHTHPSLLALHQGKEVKALQNRRCFVTFQRCLSRNGLNSGQRKGARHHLKREVCISGKLQHFLLHVACNSHTKPVIPVKTCCYLQRKRNKIKICGCCVICHLPGPPLFFGGEGSRCDVGLFWVLGSFAGGWLFWGFCGLWRRRSKEHRIA